MKMRESLKALEPRIVELRKRHANNPVKLRESMIREYQKAGVNPVRDSGFGLMAVQLPLGMAVYTVIRTGVGSGNPFLWIANLARPDVGMGVTSFLVVFHLSSGVALYWASTTSVSVLQNALLRRSLAAL